MYIFTKYTGMLHVILSSFAFQLFIKIKTISRTYVCVCVMYFFLLKMMWCMLMVIFGPIIRSVYLQVITVTFCLLGLCDAGKKGYS